MSLRLLNQRQANLSAEQVLSNVQSNGARRSLNTVNSILDRLSANPNGFLNDLDRLGTSVFSNGAKLAPLIQSAFTTIQSSPSLNSSGVTVTPRKDAQGNPINSSEIKIPFSQSIQLGDTSKMKIQAAVFNPSTGKSQLVAIPITSAKINPANNKELLLQTDRLAPKGAAVALASGALKNSSGQSINMPYATFLQSGVDASSFTLANRAFKPTDINLFTQGAYPNSKPVTVASQPVSESTAKSQFNSFMQKKVNQGKIKSTDLTALQQRFDNAKTKQIIPDPNLRAALLSLAGTSFAPAINAILDGDNMSGKPYAGVRFVNDSELSNPGNFGEAFGLPDGRIEIRVNKQLQGEPFQALSGLLAHEAVHQDRANSQHEEVFATFAEGAAYAQQLLVDSSIAQKETLYTRTQNETLLGILNSGKSGFPGVGLFEADHLGSGPARIFPGGRDLPFFNSFDNSIRAIYSNLGTSDTPGNSTTGKYIQNLTGQTASNLGLNTLKLIDGKQKAISNDAAAKQLAAALKLSVS
ncbi:MAG: hypothetical protein SFZ03_09230 [Candidatus Melainabacteria bacterium]|nr:hypothetical protein [Candidatus Melainabacteria bacterium]